MELLLKTVSEEEMHQMVIRDNVKSWLTDRCKYVEGSSEDQDEGKASEAAGSGEKAAGSGNEVGIPANQDPD